MKEIGALGKNLQNLKLIENFEIIEKDIYEINFFKNLSIRFDVIFMDPPYKDKDLKEARRIYKKLLPIIRLVGGHRYVSATKAALMEIGQSVGLPRSPRLPLPDSEMSIVKRSLRNVWS